MAGRKILWLALFFIVVPWGAGRPAEAVAPSPGAVRFQPAATADDAGARSVGRSEETTTAGPILRLLQRRKLGATFKNIRRIVGDMKADGTYDEFVRVEDGETIVDISALAVEVAQKLKAEKPGSWWDDIDWEALFAFIERLLILIIELFG